MSRTIDHSRRVQRPARSRSNPGSLPRMVCAVMLATSVSSIAFAGERPTGPAPSPLDFGVIHGLVSPGAAGAGAGATTTSVPTEAAAATAESAQPAPTSPATPPVTQGQQATPGRSVQPPAAVPGSASAAESGAVEPPPNKVPGRAAGQPAPMSADMIGGLTRTDRPVGGAGSAKAATTSRPLPKSQMDLIEQVFAPEQVR